MFSPLNRPRKASNMLSKPSVTCSRYFSLPCMSEDRERERGRERGGEREGERGGGGGRERERQRGRERERERERDGEGERERGTYRLWPIILVGAYIILCTYLLYPLSHLLERWRPTIKPATNYKPLQLQLLTKNCTGYL